MAFIALSIPGIPEFYVCGQKAEAHLDIERIAGPCAQKPTDDEVAAPINVKLSRPVRIPAGLVTGTAFKDSGELANYVGALPPALKMRFFAEVIELQRRLRTVEVEAGAAASAFLGLSTPFGAASAFAGATVQLNFWATVDSGTPTIAFDASIAIAAYARVQAHGVIRAVSLVLLLTAGAEAGLRIDADDLGLSFPTFTLPSFDLKAGPLLLALKDGLSRARSLFSRLTSDVAVSVEHTNPDPAGTQPKLALELDTASGRIDWAIVTDSYASTEKLANTNKFARFKFTASAANAPDFEAVVSELQLGVVQGKEIIGAKVSANAPPLVLDDGTRRFGPFEIAWQQMTVTPAFGAYGVGAGTVPAGASLRATIAFERLTIRAVEDPDAFLSFKGKVEIDASGARVLALELLAPFPLQLIANAGEAMLRGAASVLTVMLDFAGMVAEQAERLLDILGRLALAAGRAAIFVAEQAGAALTALGELIAGSLAAVAEVLGTLLRRLAGLLDGVSASGPAFALELRIATDPFELRQVLVTSRAWNAAPNAPPRELAVLGFKIAVPQRWQPGLLLDFVALPGAYLVLNRADESAAGELHVASLSTDLWLDTEEDGKRTRTALRDADGSKPASTERDASQPPLLALHLKLEQVPGSGGVMVVLAGLSRGEPVFLQRLAGETTPVALPGKPGVEVRTINGPILLKPLKDGVDVDVEFQSDRILPLLGMGETGDSDDAGGTGGDPPGFLEKLKGSLSNVVWVKDTRTEVKLEDRQASVTLTLGLKAAGLETSIDLTGSLSLDTLALKLSVQEGFDIASRRIEETALGLVWIIEQADEDQRKADTSISMFKLGFAGGQSGLELNTASSTDTDLKGKARMRLQFNGLSSDGQGVVFEVNTFKIGPGGLDLSAKVASNPVRLNGIDVPFHFKEGALEIRGGRLVSATAVGSGALPKDLIGEAACTVALSFAEVPGEGIVLQSGKVELDKKGDPVVCHSTRFTLTISDLDVGFVRDGGYHFYFLVTGSLRFTPRAGEFDKGLLQYLDGVEMELERTPLSADPRVLLKHISYQKALNPKKSFNLFNLFTFELRGFGFHPASPKFEGSPAVNLSGQIKFVEIGDVMQPSIEFHGLWIAPPKSGESLPRIKADGLGIDLNLKGSIRVRGSVIAVDQDTRTVEGKELAPDGYNTYGFLGSGEFDIPGWGTMGASLGFLELERKDHPGERRKSFFFYAEKKKLAIEIPTVIWTFYLREAGFGLGYRYTLEAIAAADRATSIPKLINALDEVSKTQGDLHRFSAWKPEPEGDRATLALKGALQAYPANKEWNEKAENEAQNPFMFDLVAAIRSDFTLFMGLRGWLGTNYIDYLNDKDGLRAKPGLRGYLYISAPQQRLLARMIGDSKGYIGERIPALAKEQPMRRALQSIDWSATLFIKPGLFHYELGWPNQLVARLMDEENMKVTVRGGMIFRAAEDGLLWAYNIEADAFFRFRGSVDAGSVGVSAEATLTATLVARVLCYLSWRFKGSLVYGLIALDARLVVSFRAWMEIDLGFKSFTIRIGFSATLQFSAAVEIALSTEGLGARVSARVGVSVFGCTLSVGVGFTLGQGQLDEARARVQRFLAMSITAEQPDAAPAGLAAEGDRRLESDARHAEAPYQAPKPTDTVKPQPAGTDPKVPPNQKRAQLAKPARETETGFWCIIHQGAGGQDAEAYALLLPKPACKVVTDKGEYLTSAFYAPGCAYLAGASSHDEAAATHTLVLPTNPVLQAALGALERFDPHQGDWTALAAGAPTLDIRARWNKQVKTEADGDRLTLGTLFDECYLTDITWLQGADGVFYRQASEWKEPPARLYRDLTLPAEGSDEQKSGERDRFQRDHQAAALRAPEIDAVHQLRSTVLAMFADQFVELANGAAFDRNVAHVTDLGLVFRGKVADLEKLDFVEVEKHLPYPTAPGKVEVLNPRALWFDQRDPELASDRFRVAPDGVKLDWKLRRSLSDEFQLEGAAADPEQHLQYYEIERTLEGQEFSPRVMRVKAGATLGDVGSDGSVKLLAPEWQFGDDLADLPAELRQALLPSKDEAASLEGAVAWERRFHGRDSISLSYTVTPVDIAGARGLPKSFLVDIQQPRPPLRPAEAELRFIVKHLGAAPGSKAPHVVGSMPKGALAVVMALRDSSIKGGPDEGKVRRYYRLYADPENISPSGFYGGDALTERPLGLPPAADASMPVAADARCWELQLDDFVRITDLNDRVPDDSFIDPLEPDHDTLALFPYWARLAGVTGMNRLDDALPENAPKAKHTSGPKNFLESLWRRHADGTTGSNPRIATRFTLETVQEHAVTIDGKTEWLRVVSRRVPVAVEVRIEPTDLLRHDIGLLRPEAFEWPIHLEMPPHLPGQVRASTGFARFLAPAGDATLASLLDQQPGALRQLRDPERRILTKISFDAAPVFDDQALIDAAHASSVAGYDLHELDLDELARLDTAPLPAFGRNAPTWERARRVARIERSPRQAAHLNPDNNKDWQGWQAHYPSETWRAGARGEGPWAPRRAAWYSAAESTIGFARRMSRNRLFPTASEGTVAALMTAGRPSVLSVGVELLALQGTDKDAVAGAVLALELVDLAYGSDAPPAHLALGWNTKENGTLAISAKDGQPMRPDQIRAALLRIGLRPADAESARRLAGPAAAVPLACRITVTAVVDGRPADSEPPRHVEEVALHGPLHPLLEEVLGELEYTADTGLYRRYVVSAQAAQPIEAQKLAGFLAATPAEADPYGWGCLQQLGLARTIRLYDRDLDRFELPAALARRVRNVFGQAVARYRDRYQGMTDLLGQPFADVLLRPGEDRVPGPFDAILETAGVEREYGRLALDDSALSTIQISLRPVPVAHRHYYRLSMSWEAGYWPEKLRDKPAADPTQPPLESRSLIGYELAFGNDNAACELIDLVSGRLAALEPGRPLLLPVLHWKKGHQKQVQPTGAPAFLLRTGSAGVMAMLSFRLMARVRVVTRKKDEATKKEEATVTEELLSLEELEKLVDHGTIPKTGLVARRLEWIPAPDMTLGVEKEKPSPYERFAALPAETWAAELKADPHDALATLRANMRLAAPALAWPASDGSTEGNADYLALGSQYLPWSQRFLDHAAAPQSSDRQNRVPHLALAAPVKANPLRLAADAQGQISLSFLHADRWAHARVYALRPSPRYQNLALGAGYFSTPEQSENLVTPWLLDARGSFKRELGYALAASPRTEAIEPPVFLGSRLLPAPLLENSKEVLRSHWEVVLARHGEEALAFSNRSLFARLGTEGTALSFVREYRHGNWPQRLAVLFDTGAPKVAHYPQRAAGLAAVDIGAVPAVMDEDVHDLAQQHPALWKGADIWRLGQLPAHYRVTALAAARAGIVVSRVVASVQDNTPRRPLKPAYRGPEPDGKTASPLLDAPALNIVRDGDGAAKIRIAALRLISHADVSEAGAHAWFTGGADDIAWWPDPDVRYSVLTRGGPETARFEDEEAELVLVARPLDREPDDKPKPIVVRSRGTRFVEDGFIGLRSLAGGGANARDFHLELGLRRRADTATPEERRVLLQPASPAAVAAFNDAARHFARIDRQRVRLQAGPFDGMPPDPADVPAWLRSASGAVRAQAGAIEDGAGPDFAGAVTALQTIAAAMEAEAGQLDAGQGQQGLSPQRARFAELEMAPVDPAPIQAGADFALKAEVQDQLLVIRDLPTGKEAEGAKKSGLPAAGEGGRLWQLCRERLLGAGTSLHIRAVDTRNAIAAQGPRWIAAGVTETEITLPGWFGW